MMPDPEIDLSLVKKNDRFAGKGGVFKPIYTLSNCPYYPESPFALTSNELSPQAGEVSLIS